MTKEEALDLALEALEKSVATCFDRCAHEQVMSRPEHFINQAITAIKQALAEPVREPVAWRRFNGSRFEYIEHMPALSGMVSEDWMPLHDPSQPTAPVQSVDFEAIIDDIEAIDCRYRGDPSYDRDAYWMRDEVVALVKRHSSFYTTAAEQPAIEQSSVVEPAPVQEPVAWVDLLKQAEEVVRSKSLWKKYIDGTPLANDIAVWMASFAQEHTTLPAQPAPVQEPRPSFADVVRAEPTELIQKWRVLELYRAYEHCQFQATTPPAAKRQWVGLTDEEVRKINQEVWGYVSADHTRMRGYAQAIEAKLKEKNT